MKKLVALVALVVALCLNVSAKDLKTIVFTTQPQMTCENCENKIKGTLRFEKGVKDITTSVANQTVTIVYDGEKTNATALKDALGKIGYSVTEKSGATTVAAGKKCATQCGKCKKAGGCDKVADCKNNPANKAAQCAKKASKCAEKAGKCAEKAGKCAEKAGKCAEKAGSCSKK